MALSVQINANARIFRLFDLADLLRESDIDLGAVDWSQQDEIDRLYKRVTEFVETGEVGAYDDMLFHMHGFDPETAEITLRDTEERQVLPDELTLVNLPVGEIVREIEGLDAGKIVLSTLTNGDAQWDFDSDLSVETIDPSALSVGYFDCGEETDQYDVLANALFDYLCDTFSTDRIAYDSAGLELADFVFHPSEVYGQLFRIVEDETGLKTIEKIDPSSAALQDQSWQLLVNRFNDM